MISVTSNAGSAGLPAPQAGVDGAYELRFAGLFNAGRGYAFPCDENGNVDLDSLGGRARINYFYARTAIGREFCAPVTRLVRGGAIE